MKVYSKTAIQTLMTTYKWVWRWWWYNWGKQWSHWYNAEQYYTSGVWEQKVDNILTGIRGIDQTKHANAQVSRAYHRYQPQSSTVEIHSLTQHLLINPSSSDRVISWHFPSQYSQSTLTGQLGSNACTFIALSYSNLYFSSPETLNSSQPLSNT